jgi:hypothetical protein
MAEKYLQLDVSSHTIEPFVLCLALGTVEAIKSEVWNSEAGIWTIRRPIFFEKLKSFGIPQTIIDKLGIFDELSAIEQACNKDDFINVIESIESIIKTRLKDFNDIFWYAKWSEL